MDVGPHVLGVSLHHALGGRPVWLVVTGERGNGEASAAAAMAGLRLSRLPAGAAGRLPLDEAYFATFRRVGGLAVVATASASAPAAAAAAQRAVDAAAGALLEAFAGRVAEVTLANAARIGAALQMTLRRALSGAGTVPGILGGKFDFATIQLAPDAPADDSVATAARSANDTTSPVGNAASDATAAAWSKADLTSEALRLLRVPLPSTGASAVAAAAPMQLSSAPSSWLRFTGSSSARLELLPTLSADVLTAHPRLQVSVAANEANTRR